MQWHDVRLASVRNREQAHGNTATIHSQHEVRAFARMRRGDHRSTRTIIAPSHIASDARSAVARRVSAGGM
jgi:hypothetical protein